jgi:hypothetical protein
LFLFARFFAKNRFPLRRALQQSARNSQSGKFGLIIVDMLAAVFHGGNINDPVGLRQKAASRRSRDSLCANPPVLDLAAEAVRASGVITCRLSWRSDRPARDLLPH